MTKQKLCGRFAINAELVCRTINGDLHTGYDNALQKLDLKLKIVRELRKNDYGNLAELVSTVNDLKTRADEKYSRLEKRKQVLEERFGYCFGGMLADFSTIGIQDAADREEAYEDLRGYLSPREETYPKKLLVAYENEILTETQQTIKGEGMNKISTCLAGVASGITQAGNIIKRVTGIARRTQRQEARKEDIYERINHPQTAEDIIFRLRREYPWTGVPSKAKNKKHVVIGYHYNLQSQSFDFSTPATLSPSGLSKRFDYEVVRPYFVPETARISMMAKECSHDFCATCGTTSASVYYPIEIKVLRNVPVDELERFNSFNGQLREEMYKYYRRADGLTGYNTDCVGRLGVKTSISLGDGTPIASLQSNKVQVNKHGKK